MIAFSPKQILILKAIKDKRSDGKYCDVYDLMDILPYEVKRDALTHSIIILVNAGYVQRLPKENRGGRARTPFMVTASGHSAV